MERRTNRELQMFGVLLSNGQNPARAEFALTENISSTGARVLTDRAWEAGSVMPKVGQPLSTIRVLVTDDSPDWRRQVHLLLQARPEWQVIAEALDGSEAAQKVEELKPDLILLDIGLPKLNGIEAARQIRKLSPSSKIVFLSQNNDRDVVRAALSTGALGYVCKADAEDELLSAVETALRGKQFVSGSLERQ